MTIKAKRKEVAPLVNATFPEYTGRKFSVEAAKSVTLYDLNWGGGTRNQYRTCTLSGDKLGSADKWNAVAPWVNLAEGKTVEIPRGAAIVMHSIFCGKDSGITIYMNLDDMPKWIE